MFDFELQCAFARIWFMDMPLRFIEEEAAALVEWALYLSVLIPAFSMPISNHL